MNPELIIILGILFFVLIAIAIIGTIEGTPANEYFKKIFNKKINPDQALKFLYEQNYFEMINEIDLQKKKSQYLKALSKDIFTPLFISENSDDYISYEKKSLLIHFEEISNNDSFFKKIQDWGVIIGVTISKQEYFKSFSKYKFNEQPLAILCQSLNVKLAKQKNKFHLSSYDGIAYIYYLNDDIRSFINKEIVSAEDKLFLPQEWLDFGIKKNKLSPKWKGLDLHRAMHSIEPASAIESIRTR